MGNISNPVVNRLGINVFWYNFWFSKHKYSYHLQKNNLVLLLLQIYLKYGLDLPKNVYTNPYWFARNSAVVDKTKYYRWSLFFNELNKSQTRHRFRVTAGLFYKTRLILLKYNKWVLVLTQWFEPDRRKQARLTRSRQRDFQNVTFFSNQSAPHVKRVKTLSNTTLVAGMNPTLTYRF